MRWRTFTEHYYRHRQPYSRYRQAVQQFYNKVKYANKRSFSVVGPSQLDTSTRSAYVKSAHASTQP
ncbi:hypothetical protein [Pontibacter actiniarum]|uniref:Uncharacterized protein n=1 Tax=Pontibacter actiniarum TaxID=323450 RepID=A0A1X9YNM8_9BACT|nr:hypothetical protein [Pontibacter actiniarum]ARS34486.1 hypothetical protein CA264_02965 [Pontibacter actiniarum]